MHCYPFSNQNLLLETGWCFQYTGVELAPPYRGVLYAWTVEVDVLDRLWHARRRVRQEVHRRGVREGDREANEHSHRAVGLAPPPRHPNRLGVGGFGGRI